MKNFKLSRRAVLKGAGASGVVISLPLLEAMLNSKGLIQGADAQNIPVARKLIIFHFPRGFSMGWAPQPNGVWFPNEAGALPDQLPYCLSPLAAYADQINILSGIDYEAIGNGSGPATAMALLTGRKLSGNLSNLVASGLSVDEFAHQRMHTLGQRPIRAQLYEDDLYPLCWQDAGKPLRISKAPSVLFQEMFGTPSNTQLTDAALQKSILDDVAADIEAYKKNLGRTDNLILDEHLQSIRDVEKTIQRPIECTSAPAVPNTPLGYDQAETYAELIHYLTTLSLQCDLSRVAVISMGGTYNDRRTYPFLNISRTLVDIVYDNAIDAQTAEAYHNRIAQWHIKMFADLLSRLTQKSVLGSSLLDESAVIALSEYSEGGYHLARYLPVIVAGKAGRRGADAMKTGLNLRFSCGYSQPHENASWCDGKPPRTINDVWQSALTAVGALRPDEKWGDPSLNTAPLPGLWS